MAVFETTVGIVFTLFVYFINGQNLNTTVVFSPSELIRDSNLVNNSLKLALRYGFQQTAKCKDFSKAFICVQKCLDLGFGVAHSDRYCFCTCFHKSGKFKSAPLNKFTKKKWMLGAPTTKIPFWASTRKDKKKNVTEDIQYVLVDGNASDIITENPTDETEITGGNSTDVTREVSPHHGTHVDKLDLTSLTTSATGVTHDGSAKTGDGSKDVTGTGSGDGTKDPNKGTDGTNASGVTEPAQNGTKPNDAPTGGTGAPKAGTGGPTTGA